MTGMNGMIVLRFIQDGNGLLARAFDGKKVRVHRDYEGTIGPDETWFCGLTTNPNSNVYFAIPVMNLDEYMKDHGKEVAEEIWSSSKNEVLGYMDEYVSKEIEEEGRRKDEYIQELEKRISSLESSSAGVSEPEKKEDTSRMAEVYYSDEDTIECDGLDGTYAIRLSSDLRKIRISKNENGTYEAHGGVLVIPGLKNFMLGYKGRMMSVINDGVLSITIDPSFYGIDEES